MPFLKFVKIQLYCLTKLVLQILKVISTIIVFLKLNIEMGSMIN